MFFQARNNRGPICVCWGGGVNPSGFYCILFFKLNYINGNLITKSIGPFPFCIVPPLKKYTMLIVCRWHQSLTSFTGSGVLHFEVTPFRILSLSHLADAGVGDVIGTTECVLVVTDTDPDVSVLVHLTGEVVPAGWVLVASPGDVTDLAFGLCAYLTTFTPVARDSSLAGLVLLLRTGAAITGSAIRWDIFLSHGETKESQETRNEHYSLHSVAADEVLTTFPPLPKI